MANNRRPNPPPPAPTRNAFINLSNAALTVRGPVTGIEYRFDGPGKRVEVDARDRVLLAALRQLRQIS
jgi:hypothetical protein